MSLAEATIPSLPFKIDVARLLNSSELYPTVSPNFCNSKTLSLVTPDICCTYSTAPVFVNFCSVVDRISDVNQSPYSFASSNCLNVAPLLYASVTLASKPSIWDAVAMIAS